MNDWEQLFSQKMEALCEQSNALFDRIAEERFAPPFERFVEFVSRWDMQASRPSTSAGMKSFKFALTEDAYVLVFFRLKGIDRLECEYECWLPAEGKVEAVQSTTELDSVESDWVESCFQVALDKFVTRFSEARKTEKAREPALA